MLLKRSRTSKNRLSDMLSALKLRRAEASHANDLYHQNPHVFLIGYQRVGKSIIAKNLAQKLAKKYINFDAEIESLYKNIYHKMLTYRQIANQLDQQTLQLLERDVLLTILASSPAIVSLNANVLSNKENQELIKAHISIHVKAPRGIVFERMMISGRDAFKQQDPIEYFTQSWNEQTSIYNHIAQFTIMNDRSVDCAVNQIVEQLSL